jgi:hypothetical protein
MRQYVVMKSVLTNLVALALIVSSSSCYYDNPPGEVPIAIENVSFTRDIVPIFSSSCLGEGCHAGDHEPNLTPGEAFSSLQKENSSGELFINLSVPDKSPIYLELQSGNMPPAGSLSRIEIEFIRAWIQKGAFND